MEDYFQIGLCKILTFASNSVTEYTLLTIRFPYLINPRFKFTLLFEILNFGSFLFGPLFARLSKPACHIMALMHPMLFLIHFASYLLMSKIIKKLFTLYCFLQKSNY